MEIVLLFFPIILIALASSYSSRFFPKYRWAFFILSAMVVTFLLTPLNLAIGDYLHPPDPDRVHCGNVMMGVFFLHLVILTPIALLFQWLANKWLFPAQRTV
jgi:hypothetical protein